MKEKFYEIIGGRFLVSEQALKHWVFIVFISLLALIMVGSSHQIDRKVRHISKLNMKVVELKSEYVEVRMQYMQSKLESRIISEMAAKGIVPSSTPPKRIRVVKIQPEEYKDEAQIALNN